ncbi:proteasome subunit beta type [Gregarina niphandrodes]|uniref:Proteasome subunit beta n=1 Tax=Gregarina niphandrodes TaxID=110365 RepID=A0A023B5L0_GRENI|nr:proteasome subunit beta type [Gregarina niphandrodes]EZG61149.1 proteasome subunit beta type [Gregarina niphandrodes]|eukprot:XP_011130802.1 proteasome subunit beta type [Gregarina niphandrodes]
MDYVDAYEQEQITFEAKSKAPADLDALVKSNAFKTGTTICGVIAKDCVVLAADMRATMGSTVSDKHCFKLHRIYCNLWCAGAGVAADLDHITMNLSAELHVFARQIGSLPRVETCVTRLCNQLFKYQGFLKTALIVGGVNPTGEMSLWYVSPDGYSHSLPYMAMGSGGLYANSMLEAGYKKDMDREQAKELCADAIQAGVMNDLASGTGVNLVVLSLNDPWNPVLTRKYRMPVLGDKVPYTRPPFTLGQTKVLKEIVREIRPFKPDQICEFLS